MRGKRSRRLTCVDCLLSELDGRRGAQRDGRGQLEPVVDQVHRDGRGQYHPAPAALRVIVPVERGPFAGRQRRQRTRVGRVAGAAARARPHAAHQVVRDRGARPVVGRPVLDHVVAVLLQPHGDHHRPRVTPRHQVHVAVQLHGDGRYGRRRRDWHAPAKNTSARIL